MHELSLPPSDRPETAAAASTANPPPETFPCDEGLRTWFRELRENPNWSNRVIGNRLPASGSVVSEWLNDAGNKYSGDMAKLEARARELQRNVLTRRATGIETVPKGIYAEIRGALEYIRNTGGAGAIYAESGEGKTRSLELYLRDNPACVLFHVRSWTRDMGSIVGALMQTVGTRGYSTRTKREEFLLTKLRGSQRLLVVDDAHKLTAPALQWLYDFADESGCPLALVGTPDLEGKVNADGQRSSRTSIAWRIACKKRAPLITHLVREILPDVDGEIDAVVGLCEETVEEHGHFRNCEQQLKMARRQRQSDAKLTWAEAFKRAGQLMPVRPMKEAA